MVKKKFSNAQEVNILSSSNVNFYTILSHVLDSELLKTMIFFFFFFFFFKSLTSSHHSKGYFSNVPPGGHAPRPPLCC